MGRRARARRDHLVFLHIFFALVVVLMYRLRIRAFLVWNRAKHFRRSTPCATFAAFRSSAFSDVSRSRKALHGGRTLPFWYPASSEAGKMSVWVSSCLPCALSRQSCMSLSTSRARCGCPLAYQGAPPRSLLCNHSARCLVTGPYMETWDVRGTSVEKPALKLPFSIHCRIGLYMCLVRGGS